MREMVFGRWRDGVWEMNRCEQIERDRRNKNQIMKKWIYRPSVKLDRCRYQEVLTKLSREVSRKRSSIAEVSSRYQGTTHQIQEQKLNRSTRCRETIEEAGAIRKAIRNSWRSSKNSKVSMRYRGGVEPTFKISFSRCEKHRHECNPTCNSTNDPINTIISQNRLSIKILSTWISKTHTHTHNKFNQFYFKNQVKTV